MTSIVLTTEERQAIEGGPWFALLPAALREEILACAVVRRHADGLQIASRGQPATDWIGVAAGALRLSSVSMAGKQIALTYAEPGSWFGDIALIDGLPRTHDATTHGATTLLVVRRPDFEALRARHPGFGDALLQLNCRRMRQLLTSLEDLHTKPLAARLAKQVLHLSRRYGSADRGGIRIGLQLAQEDLAQLVGASRQRVNQELKGFERHGALRIEPARLVVLSREKLAAIAER
ncbi:Crp/Fnr family transcriptional regulator [Sphaerotilus hippei]|uniref:Crp/Fnr family transcriptional regulator n=1 Tax=Sphaerotilus hippei TaxID=744406 RepID=A0A318GY15_9BURK|nr:Crp/Fnr family transcriptional regulator [Sphaerotilus hippei]PXW94741.1 Crp/Fnr family transcriptional regulator [Sphaerotilus hippei]